MTDAVIHGRAPHAHRAVVEIPPTGSGPLVVVVHEAWGLSPDITASAARLSRAGFVAVAPDLLEPAGSLPRAVRQATRGRGPAVDAALDTIDWALGLREVEGDRVGVVGFGLGGTLALALGRHPAVAAISVNYCFTPRHVGARRDVPVLAIFAADDRLLPGRGRRLGRLLRAAGVDHRIEVYPETGHSFMTPVDSERSASRLGRALRLEHDQLAARAAWRQTVAFLSEHIPAGAPPH